MYSFLDNENFGDYIDQLANDCINEYEDFSDIGNEWIDEDEEIENDEEYQEFDLDWEFGDEEIEEKQNLLFEGDFEETYFTEYNDYFILDECQDYYIWQRYNSYEPLPF
jgi:hypothetical protein